MKTILAEAESGIIQLILNAWGPLLGLILFILAIYWMLFPWLAIRWLKKIHDELKWTRRSLDRIQEETDREAERQVAEWERKHPPQALP